MACRISLTRKVHVHGCFLLCATLILCGTLYLIASPDPDVENTKSSKVAGILNSKSKGVKGHVCDDPTWGPHRLSVIIPFRDRLDELLEFVPYMENFLCSHKIRHRLLVINQVDPYRFNRGALLNVGFLLSENETFDYVALHDVDLLPVNQNLSYSYPDKGPMHVSAPALHPKYHYEKFLGGILLMTNEHFRKVRGFSNNFWGWGREDDEFYRRVQDAGLTIHRPEGIVTGNRTFRHIHDNMRRPRDGYRYGDQKAFMRRDKLTGVESVAFSVLSKRRLNIDDEYDVTIVNVQLSCDLELTPWCLTPRQLTAAVQTQRTRLKPDEFARLQDSLRRHGLPVTEEQAHL